MIDQQQQQHGFFPMDIKCSMVNGPGAGHGDGHSAGMLPANENNNNLNNVINNNAGTNNNSCSASKTSSLQQATATCSPVQSTTAGTTPPASTPGSAGAASNTMTTLCGQCCSPICDRYIMKVVDISYHERCLQCTSCAIMLRHSCFMRDGKLYCRFDYERLYGRNRCLGCGEKIGADELVMRALDNVFHLKCFICVVCGVRLQKGDQYVIKQSQLFCRPDYEKEVEMFQGYNYDDYCCDDIFQTRIDGRRGPKRPRTILTTQQRRAFKASFEVSPKPCRKIREGLAKDTGLSIRIVQVWFQNQRAKMKKIQKKQLKEGNKGNHNSNSSSKGNESQDELSENETKLSVKIKDENSRSNNYLHDSCSDTEGGINDNDSFGSRISSGAEAFKPVKEELEMDEEYFRLMNAATRFGGKAFDDPSTIVKSENIPLSAHAMMGIEYPSLQQLTTSMTPPHAQLLNPIDRLYSMQNSYFCNPPSVDGGSGDQPQPPPPAPPGGPAGHMQHHHPHPHLLPPHHHHPMSGHHHGNQGLPLHPLQQQQQQQQHHHPHHHQQQQQP